MKFVISLMILSAATVSAIPAGSKECETIYQRCMETITPYECERADKDCLCKAWGDIVTCLKPCANTPRFWLAKENTRGYCV
ncbi:hypothetical protein QYS62_009376 [Fusarium acuminatum]|uniref:Extracellular membrane protein CFEM domain-containing protein n=2 Tax=Fusarium tricinctum species complex TaxID=679429 RepID=A0ABZ2X5B7_9HYPO